MEDWIVFVTLFIAKTTSGHYIMVNDKNGRDIEPCGSPTTATIRIYSWARLEMKQASDNDPLPWIRQEDARLHLMDGTRLLINSGTLHMMPSSYFVINHAKVTINHATLRIGRSIDIRLKTDVPLNSFVFVQDQAAFWAYHPFVVGEHAKVNVGYGSKLSGEGCDIGESAQLLIQNAARFTSDGRFQLGQSAILKMMENTKVHVGAMTVQDAHLEDATELIIGKKAHLYMEKGSEVYIANGKLIMDQDAILLLSKGSKVSVTNGGEVSVTAHSHTTVATGAQIFVTEVVCRLKPSAVTGQLVSMNVDRSNIDEFCIH